MTDIFIQRPKPTKRPLVVALALLAVLIAGGLAIWLRSPGNAGSEPVTPASDPAVSDEIAAPQVSTPTAETPAPHPSADEAESPSPAPANPSEPVTESSLLDQARQLKAQDRLEEARAKCLELIAKTTDPTFRKPAKDLAGELAIALAFSPRAMAEKIEYTVQSGDSMAKLAKQYNTTVDLIQKGNGITGSNIRIGDRLRILQGNFTIEVNKEKNELMLYLNNQFFKRYAVGTGEYGKTPTGTFKITEKIPQPTWWRPDGKAIPYGDPENVLGTHWLSLDVRGYGIHGTWQPETIGKQASAGCIRLLNQDIEELYTLVPTGTPVTIK